MEASESQEMSLSSEQSKPEQRKEETSVVEPLNPVHEESEAVFPSSSRNGRVGKATRPRHPKRVRIYREDGSFFRVNIKDAEQYGYVPKI